MRPTFIGSRTSIRLRGTAVPGAEDRQRKIGGFDQDVHVWEAADGREAIRDSWQ